MFPFVFLFLSFPIDDLPALLPRWQCFTSALFHTITLSFCAHCSHLLPIPYKFHLTTHDKMAISKELLNIFLAFVIQINSSHPNCYRFHTER
uniref:Putative secreted protein n=1 Tax=Anopheles marajoara TaxID=58244 RepID=A0A2M4C9P6_9DIPT